MDCRMIRNSAFFSWDPGGTPSPPCTAVSSFVKWGWCLLSSLAPSYLTDILWGLMKLCQQCFHFLERSYLWTFQVLYGYINDLSFLCAVILACHFYLFYKAPVNVMATSDGHQSSEHPPTFMHLHDAGSPGPGTTKNGLPSDCKDGLGHRSHRRAWGSRLGWPWMPEH